MGIFARAYLIVVLFAASWALYVDSTLLHSEREHLLPDVLLFVVTLPSSLFVIPLYSAWPSLFSRPFAEVGWAIFCGLAPAALLFFLVYRSSRSTKQGCSRSA